MTEKDADTDTLIALVYSLLKPPIPDPTVVLDALIQSDGDVQGAAQSLTSSAGEKPGSSAEKTQGTKRKRPVNLQDWLNPNTSPMRRKHKADTDTASLFVASSSKSTIIRPKSPKRRSVSPSKRAVDLMSVLRQPSPKAPKETIPRLPPLMLSTPALVSQHTPCTLHLSILPPELACRLFYTMLDASREWKRNKWWLFDRMVESPHRTSFFARKNNGLNHDETWQEAAQFWYNGRRTDPPEVFPAPMEEACRIIENIVNAEMQKRPRLPYEWPGERNADSGFSPVIWRANVAASNCYEGAKESVGFHSDQLTYLGPCPTIASLSLGTRRIFSLREVIPADEADTRRARTFNVPLPHNSLTIMHAATQETFKHAVPPQPTLDVFRPTFPRTPEAPIEPSNCRINITFRFYRPDFHPASIPRCKCGVPTILRPDMKRRNGKIDANHKSLTDRYWWTCYAGAQNEGKGCGFWKVMDMEAEGRSVGR